MNRKQILIVLETVSGTCGFLCIVVHVVKLKRNLKFIVDNLYPSISTRFFEYCVVAFVMVS